MTVQQPSLDRATQFLDQLQAALHPQEKMARERALRLSDLFDAIAAFRREKAPKRATPPRTIDAARFSSFLAELRAGRTASRTDGRLLNVWTIAGLKEKEVPTSAVLGWLLDGRGSHGYGSKILEALLVILARKHPAKGLQEVQLGRHYRLAVEHSSFGDTNKRVDLVIDAENAVIFIEVKINARPGENQLQNYLALAQTRANIQKKPVVCLLYLSRNLPDDVPPEVVHLFWTDVADAIWRAVPVSEEATVSGAVVRQFAAHIQRLH